MSIKTLPALLFCIVVLFSPSAPGRGALGERDTVVSGKVGAELDAYLQRCELFGFSGSVLVAKKGKVLVRKGYGLARPDEGVPNTPETLYDIASASKQVTATAILKLETLGKLSTEDSIAKHLADVPAEHAGVTIQHLLNHTSGFSRYGTSAGGSDRDRAVSAYLTASRQRKAGDKFEYFNGGYALLAAIVERVAKEPYESWVQKNLFEPAGLQHTGFMETVAGDDPLLARTHDGGKLTTDYISGWGYKGMGGVVTSVSDLYLWVSALHDGKVLPKKALAKLFEPALENYACGWYVLEGKGRQRSISHGGSAPGFQTYIRYFTRDKAMVLLMSNREGMHWQVTWGLSSILVGEDPKVPLPPETVTWKPADLNDVAGVYSSDIHGRLVVQRRGGALNIGAEGQNAITLLSGSKPVKGGETFAWERSRATEIIAGLLAGDTEPIERDILDSIPKSWPSRLLGQYWPDHIEQHGLVSSFEEIGGFKDPASRRVRIWVRLRHAQGSSVVEIAFVDRKLNIFNLKAKAFPVERAYAPVDKKRFVTYDFSLQELPELTLDTRQSGEQALLLKSGKKSYEFVRVGR